MRTLKTIKLIINKTSKKIGKDTLKDHYKIKNLLETIIRHPHFKDFSLIIQTGSAIGGILVMITPRDNLATSDQLVVLSNKVDQKIDELSDRINSQDETIIERLSNKIATSIKKLGLIPQEGEIKTDLIQSVDNSSSELHQEHQRLQENLAEVTTRKNRQIGVLSVTVLVLALFLIRPSKALEVLENITNDD